MNLSDYIHTDIITSIFTLYILHHGNHYNTLLSLIPELKLTEYRFCIREYIFPYLIFGNGVEVSDGYAYTIHIDDIYVRSEAYYLSGVPAEEKEIESKGVGTNYTWYPNGRISSIYKYSPEFASHYTWHPTGNLWSEEFYKNKNHDGIHKYYYPDGKLRATVSWRNGYRHGPTIDYNPDGSINSVNDFDDKRI